MQLIQKYYNLGIISFYFYCQNGDEMIFLKRYWLFKPFIINILSGILLKSILCSDFH